MAHYLSRRILCSLPRWLEAATDADERQVATYCRLTPNEAAVLQRLSANLEAAREDGPLWTNEAVREGVLDQLLDGLLLGAPELELLVQALSPETIGAQMVLREALAARCGKEAKMAKEEAEAVPSRPLAVRVEEYVDQHAIDLTRTIPIDVQMRIAREVGSTVGSVQHPLAALRKARGIHLGGGAHWKEKANGMAHEPAAAAPAPRAPVQRRKPATVTQQAPAVILTEARAIAEAVLEHGAASFPEALRPHLIRLTRAALSLPEEP